MTELDRWMRVGPRFGAVVDAVADDEWDRPAPCAGWVARDVVGHLVGWVPGFLESGTGITLDPGPAVVDDPAGAWHSLARQVESLLATDADRQFSHPQAGDHALGAAIDQFITGDVLVHTWDLAVATGQPADLDEELVLEAVAGMEPITDMLVASGHYGVPVPVADDAGPTERLVALTGRDPNWAPAG